jgi:hypothetical protein
VSHIATSKIHGRPWKVSFMPANWLLPNRFIVEEDIGRATGKVLGADGKWGVTPAWFETPEAAKAFGDSGTKGNR